MMIMTERAKQLNAIYELMKTTTPGSPLTIKEAYMKLGDKVKNELQVRDAIRSMNDDKKKILFRVDEGRHVRYWFNPDSDPYVPGRSGKSSNESSTREHFKSNKHIMKPEVIVEKDRIIIEHPMCRVIVELKL